MTDSERGGLQIYAGLNNREIGDLLGVDYLTASLGRKRLRDKTKRNQNVHLVWSVGIANFQR
jgi:FixJ family two-component response regulator